MAEPWQTPFLDRMEEMLGRFFRYFHARVEEEGGLSPSQYFLLRLLQRRGVHTVSDLANRLGMTAAGATGLVDRLVRTSLVSRRRDEADRRMVWVELTSAGAAALEEARRLRRSILEEYFAPLSRDEADCLVDLYQKLTDQMGTTRKGEQRP